MPLAGVRVRIAGKDRTVIVTTDRSGIYSVSGLPVDDYGLSVLDVPENQVSVERKYEKEAFLDGPRPHDVPLYLDWDGVLGGTVTDEAGQPVGGWIKILRPDGSEAYEVPPSMNFTGKEGLFRFDALPFKGRYILQINPPGPRSESRYPSVYYPFALRPEDAHVFEVVDRKSVSRPVKLILRRVTRGDPAK